MVAPAPPSGMKLSRASLDGSGSGHFWVQPLSARVLVSHTLHGISPCRDL